MSIETTNEVPVAKGERDGLDILFEPIALGSLSLRNRIVMAPMGTALDENGFITDRTIAYYVRRAEGGVGTITVEGCLVAPYSEGPEPRIDADEYVTGLRRLVDALRPYDLTIGVQLMHPGRQVVTGRRVAPSPIPLHRGAPEPDELTIEEIADAVRFYADATERAQTAGFDFVEVHGAHGYLPSNFLSPADNQREDEYGGTLERRARFCREVARAIVAVGGEKMPLVWRLNGDDAGPGGMGIDDAAGVSRMLESEGVAAISVSSGTWRSLQATLAPMFVPRGQMVPLAAAVKRAVTIPVMAVGRLDDPALAAEVVRAGQADLICLGRGLIADPDWTAKVQTRDIADIRPCIACNVCVDLVGRGEAARCAVNPEVGRELEWRVEPARGSAKVMVVGGGPAGMEAARLARARGYEVTLWERELSLGGKFEVAASAPSKHEVLRARDYQIEVLRRLGVKVHLGENVSADTVRRQAPDIVVLAVGADPFVPPIPGIVDPRVVDALELLNGERTIEPGDRVVVVGGSATGCETAEHLLAQGAAVTLIEMLPSVGQGIEAITRRRMVRELRRAGAQLLTGCRMTAVSAEGVAYRPVDEGDDAEQVLAADLVALAIGWVPAGPGLADQLAHLGVPVHLIGDAVVPSDFSAAVNTAATTALAI